MTKGKIVFRVHAIQRMFERRLSKTDIIGVIRQGEVITEYQDDKPFPSFLFLGWKKGKPIHVVVAINKKTDEKIVITAYEPDPHIWTNGFRRKK